MADTRIDDEILRLAGIAGPAGSISPSEVAMALAPEWRPLLGPVRRAAVGLAVAGRIEILRKGKPIDPAGMKGVVRLRILPEPPSC
jgi:hypothetical protein